MPVRNSQIQKISTACGKVQRQHMDHIAEKGYVGSCYDLAWCTSQFLFEKHWRDQKPKPQWIKTWSKLTTIPALGCKKREIKVWSRSSGEEGWDKQFTSRIWWTSVTWRTPNLQNTSKNYKGRVVLQVRQRQRRRRTQRSFHRARCFGVSDGSGKVLGHHLKVSWYGWKNTWRELNVHSSPRWPKLQVLLRLPKEESPEIWIRAPPRQRPEGWEKIGDPVLPLAKKLVWSPIGWPSLGKKFWKKWHIEKGDGRKVPTWECLHVNTESQIILFCFMWTISKKWLEKRKTRIRCGKLDAKRNRLWRSNAID